MNEPIDADYDYADEGEATNCIHISYIEQAGALILFTDKLRLARGVPDSLNGKSIHVVCCAEDAL